MDEEAIPSWASIDEQTSSDCGIARVASTCATVGLEWWSNSQAMVLGPESREAERNLSSNRRFRGSDLLDCLTSICQRGTHGISLEGQAHPGPAPVWLQSSPTAAEPTTGRAFATEPSQPIFFM